LTERASVSVRRLAPGDEPLLERLAREDGDFDVDGRGSPLRPLSPAGLRGLSQPT
jgi:hypothetical protein